VASNIDDVKKPRNGGNGKGQKIVIENFENSNTEVPEIVTINKATQTVTEQNCNRNSWNLRQMWLNTQDTMKETFLPVDYPESVSSEYLRFILLANFSSVNVTAMSFLSTQALFIALGSTVT